MTQPTDDQLAAAAQKARADHETAETAALKRWIALPTADATGGGQ